MLADEAAKEENRERGEEKVSEDKETRRTTRDKHWPKK